MHHHTKIPTTSNEEGSQNIDLRIHAGAGRVVREGQFIQHKLVDISLRLGIMNSWPGHSMHNYSRTPSAPPVRLPACPGRFVKSRGAGSFFWRSDAENQD